MRKKLVYLFMFIALVFTLVPTEALANNRNNDYVSSSTKEVSSGVDMNNEITASKISTGTSLRGGSNESLTSIFNGKYSAVSQVFLTEYYYVDGVITIDSLYLPGADNAEGDEFHFFSLAELENKYFVVKDDEISYANGNPQVSLYLYNISDDSLASIPGVVGDDGLVATGNIVYLSDMGFCFETQRTQYFISNDAGYKISNFDDATMQEGLLLNRNAINHPTLEELNTYKTSTKLYQEGERTLYFSANGENVSNMPDSIVKRLSVGNHTIDYTPARPNYIFMGWNTSADGSGSAYESGAIYSDYHSSVLYANWQSNADFSQSVPTGVEIMNARYTLYGGLMGTTTSMQYRTDESTKTWYRCSNTITKNIKAGSNVWVRYAPREGYSASDEVYIGKVMKTQSPIGEMAFMNVTTIGGSDGYIVTGYSGTEYSIDNGLNYIAVGENMLIRNLSAGKYLVRFMGDSSTLPSDPTTVLIREPQNPPTKETFTVTNVASGQTNGSISGITSDMEMRKKGTSNWSSYVVSTVNLPVGMYEIRYKQSDLKLTSDVVTVAIKETKTAPAVFTTDQTVPGEPGTVGFFYDGVEYCAANILGTEIWADIINKDETYLQPGVYKFRFKETETVAQSAERTIIIHPVDPEVSGTKIYANGTALIIDNSSIYVDINRNGLIDAEDETLLELLPEEIAPEVETYADYSIYGGCKDYASNNVNTQIVVKNGTINSLYGGTDYSSEDFDMGNMVIKVENGNISNIYAGNVGESNYKGIATTTISGGTIGNVYGGNTNSNANLNISGSIIIDNLDLMQFYGERFNVIGSLSGDPGSIKLNYNGILQNGSIIAETSTDSVFNVNLFEFKPGVLPWYLDMVRRVTNEYLYLEERSYNYTVEHYIMNTNGIMPTTPTITSSKSIPVTSTITIQNESTDYVVNNGISFREGTVNDEVKTTVPASDGLVIKLYYNRLRNTLALSKDEGIESVTSNAVGNLLYYQQSARVIATVKDHYSFKSWNLIDYTTNNLSYLADYNFSMPNCDYTLIATSKPTEYDVTIDSGLKCTKTDSNYANYFEAYTTTIRPNVGYELPTTITMTMGGQNFEEFTYNNLSGEIIITEETVIDDVVVYGECPLIEYNVAYRNIDGNNYMHDHYTIENTQFCLPMPEPRTGYRFNGWKVTTAAQGGNGFELNDVYQPGDEIQLSGVYGDVVLTEQWLPIIYGIRFNENKPVLANTSVTNFPSGNQTCTYDQESTLPSNCMLAGYVFSGWYKDAECTQAVDTIGVLNLATINNSIVDVYAKWEVSNDTLVTVEHYVMNFDGDYPITATSFNDYYKTTEESFNLVDYKDSTLEVENGIVYKEGKVGNTVETTTTVLADGSRVIKLYYERIKHNVSMVAGPGVESVPTGGDYYYGQSVAFTATLVNNSVVWKNWTKVENGENVVVSTNIDLTYAITTSDVVLTANAEAVNYDLSYDSEFGSITGSSTANYLSEYTDTLVPHNGYGLPDSITMTMKGNNFEDFTYNNRTGRIIIPVNKIEGVVVISGSCVLKDYTVSYSAATIPAGSYNLETTSYTLPQAPTKTGYRFDGWKVTTGSQGGTGFVLNTRYDINTSEITLANAYGNAVLTAQWIANIYTITYNSNGGTGTMSNGKASHGTSFTLPTCAFTAPEGKQFKAWAIGSSKGTDLTAGDSYGFTANTTVYAIWEDIPEREVTEGKNGEWSQNDTSELNFVTAGDYSGFRKVSVDGKEISSEDYNLQADRRKVGLKPSYLKTLKAGKHILRIDFTDGYAETEFTINAASKPTKNSKSLWWLAIPGAGILTFFFILFKRRKRDDEEEQEEKKNSIS